MGQKQKQMLEHGEAWTKSHQGTCFADGRRSIITVWKDQKDWIDPKTGAPYDGFEMGDIDVIK